MWTGEMPTFSNWYTRISRYLVPQYGTLTRYLILRVAHASGMPGTFSPPPWVSNPDMHHLVRGPWLGTSFYWYRSGVFHWCWGYTERCGYNAVNFLSKLKIYTPYGVSFVSTISDLYSGSVTVVLYTISCGIGPRYNGKRLHSVTWLSE